MKYRIRSLRDGVVLGVAAGPSDLCMAKLAALELLLDPRVQEVQVLDPLIDLVLWTERRRPAETASGREARRK